MNEHTVYHCGVFALYNFHDATIDRLCVECGVSRERPVDSSYCIYPITDGGADLYGLYTRKPVYLYKVIPGDTKRGDAILRLFNDQQAEPSNEKN